MKLLLIFFVAYNLSSAVVHGWDTEELEIFDLVEEINKNFYEFMGISQVSNFIHLLVLFLQTIFLNF